MRKTAPTKFPIHDLLKERWSPRAFDSRPIADDMLWSLFEAARWSPSAANEQPWAFIIARQGGTAYDRLVAALSGNNQRWAGHAPVLIITLAKLTRNGVPNRHAYYDVGQAVAHLTIQAESSGIRLRQMGGFDAQQVRQDFSIPEQYDPVTVIALGYAGKAENLPEDLRERENAERSRKPIYDFVFQDLFGKPAESGQSAASI